MQLSKLKDYNSKPFDSEIQDENMIILIKEKISSDNVINK